VNDLTLDISSQLFPVVSGFFWLVGWAADNLTTYRGLKTYGTNWEANPIPRTLFTKIGLTKGMFVMLAAEGVVLFFVAPLLFGDILLGMFRSIVGVGHLFAAYLNYLTSL
jgi:uncharacterized protein YqgC (DUF456 family)